MHIDDSQRRGHSLGGVATSRSEFDVETTNLLNADAVEALEGDIVASLVDSFCSRKRAESARNRRYFG